MALVEQARFNLAHSKWALERLLDHADALPPEQLEQDLGIGPGGLRENLAHTIEAMFYFAANFAGVEYVEPPDFRADSKSMDGLRRLLRAAGTDLTFAVLGACENSPASIPWPNATGGVLPTAVALAQAFDHSTLHRTQAINILKRLGVRPLPDLDPMTFHAAVTCSDLKEGSS